MQILQNLVWIRITAQFHHNAHAFPVAFVTDIGDSTDLSVVDGLGQLFNPAGLAELVWQFRDDNGIALVAPFAGLHLFGVGDASHRDTAASTQIGVL